jgi:hypothetical protein
MRIWLFPSPGVNLACPSSSLVESHDQEKERYIMLLDDNSSRALNKSGAAAMEPPGRKRLRLLGFTITSPT